MPIFWRVLIINRHWILSKAFSASIEIIIWFLSFNLLIRCITLIDLHILKNPCIPGINPTCSWCMSFLMCCWILFAKTLLKIFTSMFISDIQFSSVTQSCPTLCDPMNCSTPGLSVHHQLPEFTQTHVHRVSDAIQPSHPLSSPSPPAPNPSQHHSLFQWVNSSHEVAKVLEFQL